MALEQRGAWEDQNQPSWRVNQFEKEDDEEEIEEEEEFKEEEEFVQEEEFAKEEEFEEEDEFEKEEELVDTLQVELNKVGTIF